MEYPAGSRGSNAGFGVRAAAVAGPPELGCGTVILTELGKQPVAAVTDNATGMSP